MHAYIHVYVHAYMDEWILSSLCGYMHACMYILQSPHSIEVGLGGFAPPPQYWKDSYTYVKDCESAE